MRTELEMPESVKEKVDDLIATYIKHAGKRPDFLRMSEAMYQKLCDECDTRFNMKPCENASGNTYNGIFISITKRMPTGVVDAGEWA